MTSVVFLSHRGIPCAVPASQVLGALRAEEELEPVPLFEGIAPDIPTERDLTVRTSTGTRVLACRDTVFGDLQRSAMFELPSWLRDELGLPHLVGLAETDHGLVWLVDLSRWKQ